MNAVKVFVSAVGKLLLLAVVIGGGYYVYRQLNPIPCAQPIHYSIGTFDERFGISREDFLATLEKGALIWEKPIGTDLFVYDPNGSLKINLIYDSRQATTQHNKVLESSANQTKESAASVQKQYQALKDEYAKEKIAFDAALASFTIAQKKYSADVEYYNGRGGAPKAEYDRLQAEKASLQTQQQALETMRVALNAKVRDINNLIDTYNLLAEHVNETVGDINKTAGKEFNEGLYVQDNSGAHIDIYEYSTKLKLLRVLAHELGHALGLEHNDNPKSIMYALNQSATETLSTDDLSALKMLCSIE